jgi:GNAT superfamily N-acetyltransferase
MNLTFKHFKDADIAKGVGVILKNSPHNPKGDSTTYLVLNEMTLNQNKDNRVNSLTVAYVDEKPVAMSMVLNSLLKSNRKEIHFFVKPLYRKRKIATQLFKFVKETYPENIEFFTNASYLDTPEFFSTNKISMPTDTKKLVICKQRMNRLFSSFRKQKLYLSSSFALEEHIRKQISDFKEQNHARFNSKRYNRQSL